MPGSALQPQLAFPFNTAEVLFMSTISPRLAATALASLLLISPALAQTTAPAKTDAPAAMDKKPAKEKSAESIECSKQADAKGLHGKERKKFRSDCIKNAKAGTSQTK
jgi:hypothetical protein